MENGKLKAQLLDKIINKYTGYKRDEVFLAGSLGEDCTFLNIGDYTLSISTDPVTAAESDIGKIAFNINMNDIATSGADGIGMMVTLLLPPNTEFSKVEEIMGEIHDEALKHKMQILGGHTEVTDAVNRIVVSITVLGIMKKGEEIFSRNVNEGDYIFVSKNLGIEGTLIILNDFKDKIKSISTSKIEELKYELKNSLSVALEGKIGKEARVNSMHDVTEGGIIGATYEVIKGSNKGCIIYEEKLPYLLETINLCNELGIDKNKLISSGSMLIVTKNKEKLIDLMYANSVKITEIGRVTNEGLYIKKIDGSKVPLEAVSRDEIYRLYENK